MIPFCALQNICGLFYRKNNLTISGAVLLLCGQPFVLLEVKHVAKRFPGVIALKDVNIILHRGEILGICGENGAGKSTLMKVLSGGNQQKVILSKWLLNDPKILFVDEPTKGMPIIPNRLLQARWRNVSIPALPVLRTC